MLVISEEGKKQIRALAREEIAKALAGAEELQREVGRLRPEVEELKGRVRWLEDR